MECLVSHSEQETYLLGKKLGEKASAGEIYCLSGDLGTGKTVFAQGFAAGLGITGTISSPTFTILQEYSGGRLPFYHFDAYRICGPDDMEDIGYEDYLYGDGVSLVEWACRIKELLPEDCIRIEITKDKERIAAGMAGEIPPDAKIEEILNLRFITMKGVVGNEDIRNG